MPNDTNPVWSALLKFDSYITDFVLVGLLFMGITDMSLGVIRPAQCGYILGPGLLLVRRYMPQWFPRHEQSVKF